MRRLADVLGTRPMSLYTHVRDKDDLVDGVLGLILGEVPFPPLGSAPWQELLKEGAHAYRDALLRHPGSVLLILRRPAQPGAAWVRGVERGLAIMRSAGFDVPRSVSSLRALLALIYGTVLNETVYDTARREHGFEPVAVSPADAPSLADAAPLFDAPGFDEAFAYALDTLIKGLEVQRSR